jgi:hypothetical protein
MDKLEPIRRVFCNAGLYHHAYDDLLCQELAAVAAPQPQARPHVNLSGLVAQAFATECWRAQPHASDYEIADAILEKLAPYLAAPQPQPVGEWAMVERAAIVGICRILERDGDEHGAAAELRQLLRAAPQPQAEPVGEWVMVPREPTPAMHRAYNRAVSTMSEQWAAMIDAAPPRPQASAEDVARIDDFIKIRLRCSIYGLNPGSVGWANEAWQRIRADYERMGVVK